MVKDSIRRDYLTLLLKQNSPKLAPNHYNYNESDFKIDAKSLKFPINKAARKTFTEEIMYRKSMIPGSNAYTPALRDTTSGYPKKLYVPKF